MDVVRKARHELPAVGEIEVVRAGRQRGERDPVVLRLERPGAMDHEAGGEAGERARELVLGVIQPRVLNLQAVEGALPSLRMAARGDDFHRGRHAERAADAGAEIAVAADHDDAHVLSLESRAGTRTRTPDLASGVHAAVVAGLTPHFHAGERGKHWLQVLPDPYRAVLQARHLEALDLVEI